jgi:hypothetical protein
LTTTIHFEYSPLRCDFDLHAKKITFNDKDVIKQHQLGYVLYSKVTRFWNYGFVRDDKGMGSTENFLQRVSAIATLVNEEVAVAFRIVSAV